MSGSGSTENDDAGILLPLHGGRHSLSPDVVAFSQRERLLSGLAEVVAEHGYNKATVGQITDVASVSRRTFYEHFKNKEVCFIAAYEAIDDYVESMTEAAVAAEPDWSKQVAAVLSELLHFLSTRPQAARVWLVESITVGEGMATRRQRTVDRFVALLEAGRAQRADPDGPAEGIEEALVGGILTLLARRIVAGEGDELERFTPGVVEFALAPYLGTERARKTRYARVHPGTPS